MSWIIAVTLLSLFLVGIGYAFLICKRPFPSGLTWLSVLVGCSFTNLAMSIILWEMTQDWRVALLIPWGCYALSGAPMALVQVVKNDCLHREAERYHEEITHRYCGGGEK